MSSVYYTLLTNAGASAMAYAAAHATAVDLAQVALGDGNGSLPAHTPASTALVHEVYRASINSITQDPDNAAWYIVELVVPPEVGDFWVREFRIDDAAGNPIYIGVTAPESLRIQRVVERDHVPKEKVLDRMRHQMDEKEKIGRCDFVIENDGNTALLPQVLAIHERLMKV